MKIHNLPIWLINLERSKDRLEFQQKQFKEHGLEFTRIDAVDGRKDISNLTNGLKLSHHWSGMSNGQRGCGLSHVSILKKMVAENIPAVFVMEDDVVLCENFCDEFEKFFHHDDLKYDIIYVGNQNGGSDLNRLLSTNQIRVNKPTFCTHGLIYTLQGAKNILNHIQDVGLYVYDIVLIEADSRKQLKTISYIKKPSEIEIQKNNLHVPRSVGLCYQTQMFESVIHG
jgi:GR25 family glycosyltransferase involved in LPS biosynthesis